MDPWIMPLVSFLAGLMGSVSAFFYGYGRLSAKLEGLRERMDMHARVHESDAARLLYIERRIGMVEASSGMHVVKMDS